MPKIVLATHSTTSLPQAPFLGRLSTNRRARPPFLARAPMAAWLTMAVACAPAAERSTPVTGPVAVPTIAVAGPAGDSADEPLRRSREERDQGQREGEESGTSAPPRDPAAEGARHAPEAVSVVLQPEVEGLTRPIAAASLGDGSGRLLVAEKAGRLWLIAPEGPAGGPPRLVADWRERVNDGASEQGLLGVAAHPAWASNGRLFLSYSDARDATVVVEVTTDGDAVVDPDSERLVLAIEQPARNHNGGHIAFGPDGKLWIGTGDGGRAGDPWNNAQDPDVLLGKMLRLEVDASAPPDAGYAIPVDNPFLDGQEALPEIWALGLRNPWRYHFDRLTGDLFIGDVGQNQWEEIDREPAGGGGGRNYGWRLLEAEVCFEPGRDCDPTGATTLPILAYEHDGNGCSVTGGTVYRGEAQPALWGLYLYADYCSGRVWAAAPQDEARSSWRSAVVADTGRAIATFVEDDAGELFVLDDAGGALLRVVGVLR